GEPEADETDLALGDDGLDVLRGLGELGHRRDLSPALPRPLWTRGQRATRACCSVAGDLGDEVGHLFGFLALVEARGHLPEAARSPFLDRAQHQRLAPRRRRDAL